MGQRICALQARMTLNVYASTVYSDCGNTRGEHDTVAFVPNREKQLHTITKDWKTTPVYFAQAQYYSDNIEHGLIIFGEYTFSYFVD